MPNSEYFILDTGQYYSSVWLCIYTRANKYRPNRVMILIFSSISELFRCHGSTVSTVTVEVACPSSYHIVNALGKIFIKVATVCS